MPIDAIALATLVATLAPPLSLLTDGKGKGEPSKTIHALAWSMPLVAWAAILDALHGPAGVVCAGLYMGLAVVVGLSRLRRALDRARFDTAEWGVALTWIYVAGGGLWLGVYASGGQLFGFRGSWLLLTVAHFHAAGFGATTITSLVVRAFGRGQWLLALHPIAYLTVAAGLNGIHVLERVGTVLYIVLFVAQLILVVRARPWSRPGGWLVLISIAVPLVTIALAADWALGGRHLDLEGMAWLHGLSNAVGHVALGLLAFARLAPAPRK